MSCMMYYAQCCIIYNNTNIYPYNYVIIINVDKNTLDIRLFYIDNINCLCYGIYSFYKKQTKQKTP